MKKITVLLIALLFILQSCNKEENNLINIKTDKSNLEIGSTLNMIYNYYDTIVGAGYQNEMSLELDLNNDQNPDITLLYSHYGSLGLGSVPETKIMCLNSNIKLLGYFENDTVFLDTADFYINENYDPIWHIRRYNYRCTRRNELDSIIGIKEDVFKLIPLNRDDIIKSTDIYSSDSVLLYESNYGSYGPYFYEYTEDTVFGIDSYHYKNCNNFSKNNFGYIGLKIIDDENEKLGWIKLIMMNEGIVMLIESAIQK